MDQHEQQKCTWPGGCGFNLVPGGIYCQNHRRQHFDSHRRQPGQKDVFCNPVPNPLPSVSRDPAPTRLGNGPRENGSLISPSPSRISSPKNNKKQLPNAAFTARKTVKQPANLGQTHVHPASPKQGPSSESPSANPRPPKRQRVSGVPNLSGPQPRSNSSSFSENGIPPSSKRGMLRQPEERTYKLSAIDDFALRPKKKDGAIEPARSNASKDQRQPNQNGSRPSSSSQQAPASGQRPQSAGLNGTVRPASHATSSASIMIDLTADDSERPLSRAKPQLQPPPPPKNFIPNGITGVDHQTRNELHEGNHIRNLVTPDNNQAREGLAQPRGIAQVKHGPSVEQASRNLHVHKPPQSVIPGAPSNTHIAQGTRPQINGASPKPPGNQQKPNATTRNNDMRPVHMDSSDPAKNPLNPPPIKQNQAINGISRPSVEEKTSMPIKGWTPINSVNRSVVIPDNNPVIKPVTNAVRNGTRTEQSAVKKIVKAAAQTPAIPAATDTLPQEARVMAPVENRRKEPPVEPLKEPPIPAITRIPSIPPIPSKQTVQSTPVVTLTEMSQPPQAAATKQGSLTALLGGREWKKMSPEERRRFWVSQHDPVWFDAQIYSENNRPFRPGDPLFGLPEHALPPRPTQPATHFSYIDPRPCATPHRFDSWLKKKKEEIAARGNRKANFGKAIKRAAQRKRAAAAPTEDQRRDTLPQRVRDNPNWLASVDILDQIAAQIREKRNQGQIQAHSHHTTATATTNTTINKAKVQAISAADSFFACKDGIKDFDPPYE
ncbi:hypothetical protein F5Y08DRAFT_198065 [Xylaria arbuscula]|uniref:Uncharacterized protein n=1 Tax=Xylaria arbuscula TaxID=114810 RepID=A0A9W8THN9_9PEZI|nr:hypothetical protein F5Y08DRAFT_198065 [Xylaria arbuscula]KAJ3555995.1 hypothetical protein NPX13_g10234 [Xylaria arbuscula]